MNNKIKTLTILKILLKRPYFLVKKILTFIKIMLVTYATMKTLKIGLKAVKYTVFIVAILTFIAMQFFNIDLNQTLHEVFQVGAFGAFLRTAQDFIKDLFGVKDIPDVKPKSLPVPVPNNSTKLPENKSLFDKVVETFRGKKPVPVVESEKTVFESLRDKYIPRSENTWNFDEKKPVAPPKKKSWFSFVNDHPVATAVAGVATTLFVAYMYGDRTLEGTGKVFVDLFTAATAFILGGRDRVEIPLEPNTGSGGTDKPITLNPPKPLTLNEIYLLHSEKAYDLTKKLENIQEKYDSRLAAGRLSTERAKEMQDSMKLLRADIKAARDIMELSIAPVNFNSEAGPSSISTSLHVEGSASKSPTLTDDPKKVMDTWGTPDSEESIKSPTSSVKDEGVSSTQTTPRARTIELDKGKGRDLTDSTLLPTHTDPFSGQPMERNQHTETPILSPEFESMLKSIKETYAEKVEIFKQKSENAYMDVNDRQLAWEEFTDFSTWARDQITEREQKELGRTIHLSEGMFTFTAPEPKPLGTSVIEHDVSSPTHLSPSSSTPSHQQTVISDPFSDQPHPLNSDAIQHSRESISDVPIDPANIPLPDEEEEQDLMSPSDLVKTDETPYQTSDVVNKITRVMSSDDDERKLPGHLTPEQSTSSNTLTVKEVGNAIASVGKTISSYTQSIYQKSLTYTSGNSTPKSSTALADKTETIEEGVSNFFPLIFTYFAKLKTKISSIEDNPTSTEDSSPKEMQIYTPERVITLASDEINSYDERHLMYLRGMSREEIIKEVSIQELLYYKQLFILLDEEIPSNVKSVLETTPLDICKNTYYYRS